jgi:uncharacterized repeat protein (TIGR01451 family)
MHTLLILFGWIQSKVWIQCINPKTSQQIMNMTFVTKLRIERSSFLSIWKICRLFFILMMPVLAVATPVISGFNHGMTYSGTFPFDLSAGAGKDSSASDTVIRTFDKAGYRVGIAFTGGSDIGGIIKLQMGAFSLPASYVGPAVTSIAKFVGADMPGTCFNPTASVAGIRQPLTAAQMTAENVSGVSIDGQTIICVQASPSNGQNFDFPVTIAGNAPNGATIAPPVVTYRSNNFATTSPSALVATIGDIAPGGGTYTENFYGLQTLTVSAAPRWNVGLSRIVGGGASFVPGSGPSGEDGIVFSWNMGVFAVGSRKGLEALHGTYTVTDNFNDLDFPNAKFVTWNINSPGYAAVDFSATGHNGCGNWNSELSILGYAIDPRAAHPADLGSNNNSSATSQVARGGNCDQTSVDNVAKTATLTLDNTDFSLNFYPTRKGSALSASTLVNASNLDDISNEWWVASKSVVVWAPLTDMGPVPITSNITKTFTNKVDLNGLSMTGQANADPRTEDNTHNTDFTALAPSGAFAKYSSAPSGIYNNPKGEDYAPCDPATSSSCFVYQASPGQVFNSRFVASNNSSSALAAGYICDKVDNTRATFFDMTSPAIVPVAPYVKDPLTGIAYFYLVGSAFPVTSRLGIGGSGQSGGTWSTYTSTVSEYTRPTTTTSTQASSSCDDAGIVWYSSVAALQAAGKSLSEVTYVRVDYSAFPAGANLNIQIPFKVNANYAYSGANVSPASTFTAGASTVNSITVDQGEWQTNTGITGSSWVAGIAKSAWAIKVIQTEYISIAKKSSSNPTANGLASVGNVVTYDLTVNASSTTNSHTTTVTVWDVIPNYMGYVPGSSTLGGAAIADPVCASSGLPTNLFPAATQPLAAGFMACKWVLPNQAVTKAAVNAAVANLPVLSFNAVLSISAPASVVLLNTAFADSTDNLMAKAIYGGGTAAAPAAAALAGFKCAAGVQCYFSNWILNSSATPGILLSKSVDKTLIPIDTGFTYTLNYGAVGNLYIAARILDVLPFNGDGRTPTTSYSGWCGSACKIS